MKIPSYVTAGLTHDAQEQQRLRFRAQALAKRIVTRLGFWPDLGWQLNGVLGWMTVIYTHQEPNFRYTAKGLADRLRAIRNAIRLLYRVG
jgi:hypothetical protein